MYESAQQSPEVEEGVRKAWELPSTEKFLCARHGFKFFMRSHLFNPHKTTVD